MGDKQTREAWDVAVDTIWDRMLRLQQVQPELVMDTPYALMNLDNGKVLSVSGDSTESGAEIVAQLAQILSSQWRLVRVPESRVQAERDKLLAQWDAAASAALENFRRTVSSIDFESGSWDINLVASNRAVLQGLAELLAARPWLTLYITGRQHMPSANSGLQCEDRQARPPRVLEP